MKKIAIGILAHVDAGKTTLAEAVLYNAGVIRNRGKIEHKDTCLDTHLLEKERGITIFAGEASFMSGDTEITLIDTPGHVDFSAETERVLSVIDYAVLVISSTDGVQSHTRTVWKLLAEDGIPTFIFVTKCDLERRDKEDILKELEENFGQTADFSEDRKASSAEKIAMGDEALLEEYLSDGEFKTDTLIKAIKSRKLFPCFFGSGLKNTGVKEFCDAIDKYTSAKDFASSFGAKVYKITYDKNERLTRLRVTGGTLKVKDSIEYSGITEKINQIRVYTGAKFVTVPEAPAGTVCAVTGLTETVSGQGLGAEAESRTSVLEPVMRYRILLPDGIDPIVMLPKFRNLEEEEPKLHIGYNEQLGEFHCALMGTIQAEIFKNIVFERFGVQIEITEGRVIYKETVSNTVEGVGHYEPLRHYAEVHLLIEPAKRGSGISVDTKCSDNRLEKNWQNLILTHLKEKTHLGVLTGSPLTDVKISVVGGKAHLKHTEGGDFRQATYRAVRQGLMQAQSVLLEPYYNFRLEIPVKQTGRAINDIRLMGGIFDSPVNDGEISILTGKVPVICMDGYMAEMSSYTGGLGRLSLDPAGYDLCHNAQKVIEDFSYNPENDLENSPDSVFCSHGAGFVVKWDKVKDYMHVESYFSKKDEGFARHRHISIDEKLLEEIMQKEFGSVKYNYYPKRQKTEPEDNQNAVIWGVKTKYLIIDGYNVIFGWDLLKAEAASDLYSARDMLCHILSNYSHFTGCKVIVVFDGYKVAGNKGEKQDFYGVTVVYTKENETCDTYIERLIGEIGQNDRVRVVTSDGLIQLSAVRKGVLRMSTAEFLKELDAIDSKISELIDKAGK